MSSFKCQQQQFSLLSRNPMKNHFLPVRTNERAKLRLSIYVANFTPFNTVCTKFLKVVVHQKQQPWQQPWARGSPGGVWWDADRCYLHMAFPTSLKRRQPESNWTRCVVCITLQSITKFIIFPRNIFVPGTFLFTCEKSKFICKLTYKLIQILP